MKKISLTIASLALLSVFVFLPSPNKTQTLEQAAFQTEGPCMSRILDKSPRFFPTDKCRLG